MELTFEQKKAIQYEGNNILVSAGAGSGKTFVLVERMINKIIEKEETNIDELLIVTFTNAAAIEMKERILKKIELELQKNPQNIFLQQQLIKINKAYISTIDSFCLKVVKENFKIIDIEPNFRIGEKTEIDLIKFEALENFLEPYYANKEKWFYDILDCLTKKADDNYFKEIFLKIYEQAQNSPYPNLWLKDAFQIYNIKNKDEYLNSKIFKKILEYIEEELSLCLDIKNYILKLIKNDEQEQELHQFFNEVYTTKSNKNSTEEKKIGEFLQLNQAIEYLKNNQIDEFLNAINIDFPRIKSIKNPILKEEISQLRKLFKQQITNIKEKFLAQSINQIIENNNIIYNNLKNLCNLIIEFNNYYLDIKKKKNIYTFNDISHFCLKILIDIDFESINTIEEYNSFKKPSYIAENYSKIFKEIVTDEYQDSNLIQEEILNIISNGKNRFMVGDIKQCIYRFRQADTSIFNEKYQNYKNNIGGERIELNSNFRSSKNVIESINIIFENIMTNKLGEVLYDEDTKLKKLDNQEENQLINFQQNINISKNCELFIINKDDKEYEDDEDLKNLKEIENTELECIFIAKKIKSLIEDEKIHIKKQEKYLPIQFKDIAIISRNKNFGAICSKIFEQYDIPIFAQSNNQFYEILEIEIILNMLKIIDNPFQDIPLISVMYSSIFNFSANELLEIKLNSNHKIYYNSLKEYLKNSDNTYLKDKVSNFLNQINHYKNLSKIISINELLSYIYKDSNYYNYIGILKNGKTRQANLKNLLVKSVEFEKNNSNNLFKFINYIEKTKEKNKDDTEANITSENENVVKFMTIHKSKGLEFPVVFVSNLATKFNFMETNDLILFEPDYKLGVSFIINDDKNQINKRLKINSIQKDLISEKLKRDVYSEELRILYVALTRAKEKIILTGCASKSSYTKQTIIKSEIIDEKINSPVLFRKSNNYLNWIYNILNSYENNWKIKILNKNDDFISNSIINKEEKVKNIIKFDELFDLKQNELDISKIKQIEDKLNWKYPFEIEKNLDSNLTVSEIKRNINDNSEVFQIKNDLESFSQEIYNLPKFYFNESQPSSLIKGTLYHKVFEHIDFNITSLAELDLFFQKYINKGIFNNQDLKLLDKNKILQFLNSNIAKRIKNSHKVFREYPFKIGLSPYEVYNDNHFKSNDSIIIVNGIIDLFFEENENIILVDYKTDKTNNKNELFKRYNKQMEIYRKVIENATGKKVTESIIYLVMLNEGIIF